MKMEEVFRFEDPQTKE